MYLLLVDQNLISSSDLKEMIEQAPAGSDIVNCYSQDTLLKIAAKVSPDIVIIDFDLVKGDLAGFFNDLRSKSKQAHVMALISPDYYETLFNAIKVGGIDDYMVKPVQKEDLLAKIQIATTKKRGPYVGEAEPRPGEGEEKPKGDSYEALDRYPVDEEAEPAEEEPDPGQLEMDAELPPEGEEKSILHYQGITEEDLLDTAEQEQAPFEDFPEGSAGREEPAPEEFELETGPAEGEVKPEEAGEMFDNLQLLDDQGEEEPFAEKELSETGSGYDFDDILPGPEEQDQDSELMAEEPDLFADLDKEDHKPEQKDSLQQEEDEDLRKLFEDVDNIFDTEETPAGAKEETGTDFELDPFADQKESDFEAAPDQVRPADEFLGKSKPSKSAQPIPPLAEDKQYFDDLFDDETQVEQSFKKSDRSAGETWSPESPRTKQSSDDFWQDQADDFADDFADQDFEEEAREDFYPGDTQKSREEIRRRSDLPGRSADEFLFGEEDDQDFEADFKADQDLDQFDFGDVESEQLFWEEDREPREDREKWSRSRKQKKPRSGFRSFLSIFGNILFVLLLLVMAGLSFFLIQSRIAGGVPQVAGYQMYIVLSGSMSPEFDTGSLAFVREVEPLELVVGDIITFESPNDPESLTTHRIVEIRREDGLSFITRGDANNVNDPNPVPAENVVGRVTGAVPYVGYLLNFVQTTQGLILLIFIPGVLIIVFELSKIVRYLTQGENGGKRRRDNSYNRLAEDEG